MKTDAPGDRLTAGDLAERRSDLHHVGGVGRAQRRDAAGINRLLPEQHVAEGPVGASESTAAVADHARTPWRARSRTQAADAPATARHARRGRTAKTGATATGRPTRPLQAADAYTRALRDFAEHAEAVHLSRSTRLKIVEVLAQIAADLHRSLLPSGKP